MFKQTLRFVSYLIFSILIGIAVTLTIDHFENITVEKKIRKELESELRNAVSSFNSYSNNHVPEESVNFIKRFSESGMQDKIIAVDPKDKTPDKERFKYLFTFSDRGRRIDLYIINSFLQGELDILDTHELILGLLATVAVFSIMVLYSEKKRQKWEMQKQMEIKHEEFRKALEEHEALALLGRMSATLAHELKTPVATISNLLQALPSKINDEKFTSRFTAITTEELKRTQQLIDNLLVYGKNISVTSREWLSFRPFIIELTAKNRLELTDCPDFKLHCDKFYAGLLFENLLRNSRATKAGHIHIKLNNPTSEDQYAEILFEDDGAGFPKDTELESLLAPFVTMRSNGAGLGLHLVKKISAAHNWHLELYRLPNGAGIKIALQRQELKV